MCACLLSWRLHIPMPLISQGLNRDSPIAPILRHVCLKIYYISIPFFKGRFKKNGKKWLDLSNAHLTPASQAERWIKEIQKLHHFCYAFIIFITTKFGENFEEKINIWVFFKMFWTRKLKSKSLTNIRDYCHDPLILKN